MGVSLVEDFEVKIFLGALTGDNELEGGEVEGARKLL